LIVLGYGVAFVGGIAAVAVNEMLIPEDIQQTSGGMVAFGDMVLFVLATGALSLAPTWFLLRLCIEKIPRTLIAAELLLAVLGPASWLGVRWLSSGPNVQSLPNVISGALGLFIAFGAIPRIVLGPVLLVVELATFFLIRERFTRMFLAAAMVMDLIPMSMFVLHMAAATALYRPPPSG
jgi:hypothetical protein